MNLTYAQLAEEIRKMTDEQKQMNVTVFVPEMDDFYPVDVVSYSTEEIDVLDPNHPILNINDGE